MKKGIMILAAFALLPFRAYGENPKQASEDLQTKVYELLDKDITTVTFHPGSAVLSAEDAQKIRSLVKATSNSQNVDHYIVAAWSDKDYPAVRGEHLKHQDVVLANHRREAVKKAMEGDGAGKVDTFSFAEHPSWLARTFNTEQAKLKGDGRIKDAEDRVIADIGKRLRDKGGPGTAVIVVKTRAEVAH